MIMILAFAAWSLLLAVVGIMTGVSALTYIAAGIGTLAVACSLVVLLAALREPAPHAARGYARSGRSALAA